MDTFRVTQQQKSKHEHGAEVTIKYTFWRYLKEKLSLMRKETNTPKVTQKQFPASYQSHRREPLEEKNQVNSSWSSKITQAES